MTPAERQSMAEHALYEINEFRKAVTKLSTLKQGDADWNNTIESALLHFRALRAFFFSEGKGNHPDDLFAEYYVTGWKPTKHAVFDETKSDIDKRLAHLSLRRRQVLSCGWPIKNMNHATENLISQFKKALKPPEATWFSGLSERGTTFIALMENYSTTTMTTTAAWIGMEMPPMKKIKP